MRVFGAFLAGILLGIVVCAICYLFLHTNTHADFYYDFGLNLTAEVIGVTLGTLITLVTAWYVTRRRLASLGLPLVSFIRDLRNRGLIEPVTARVGVMCVAGLLGEEGFSDTRSKQESETKKVITCNVCTMKVRLDSSHSKKPHCHWCKLPDQYWNEAKLDLYRKSLDQN